MKFKRAKAAIISLVLAGLVGGSLQVYAADWLNYDPGWDFTYQYGYVNGTYNIGTYEWFSRPDTADTQYCSTCDSNGGGYVDYRGWKRTKLDGTKSYMALDIFSQNGTSWCRTYHRHYHSGEWTWENNCYFVNPSHVEKDTTPPQDISAWNSRGGWGTSPADVTAKAWDKGTCFDWGMYSPTSNGTGIAGVKLNTNHGAFYSHPSQKTGANDNGWKQITNTVNYPGWTDVNSVEVFDRSSNHATIYPGIGFGWDDRAPTLNESHNTSPNQTSITINLNAGDTNSNGTSGSGVSRIDVWDANNRVYTPISHSSSASYTVTQNGTYWFQAVDNVGRTVERKIDITNIDGLPPTVSVTWTKRPLKTDTFTINATDNSGRIDGYMITETPEKPSVSDSRWQSSNVFTDLARENKQYYAWAKDPSGNIGQAIADVKSLDLFIPVFSGVIVTEH